MSCICNEIDTRAHTHCRGDVYINLQLEDGAYFPSLPTVLL